MKALSALVLVALSAAACGDAKKPPPAQPPVVYVAPATKRDLPLYVEAVGSLDGYVNADIRARVRGYLEGQGYKDGASVRAGQQLFSIEASEYVSAVSNAKANLARAVAAQDHNRGTHERTDRLAKNGIVSTQNLDDSTAALADADAQVAAARAQLEQANLNLSYTQIRSPIDGVVGVALVRVGNLVGQDGPTLLTTVSRIDPIRVNFPISEADYVRHREKWTANLSGRDLEWAKKQFTSLDASGVAGDDPGVELVLADGTTYKHKGIVVTVNRQIDASTGTIQVQALVPNADASLRPGQFARVRIRQREGGNVLAVPEKALISVQGSYSLGVVGADNKVHLRKVDVGASAQGYRVIDRGLAEGDRIVVEGLQKISDGAQVDARPVPAPSAANN